MLGEKGFLLLEVVIAIVIITVTLTAVTGMFIQATRMNSMAKHLTTATALAQQSLELEKKNASESGYDQDGFSHYWQSYAGSSSVISLNNTSYTVLSEPQPADDMLRTIQVKITVSWFSYGDQSVVMNALYPKVKLP